jgi:predicted ArsR family transcriptional regulator
VIEVKAHKALSSKSRMEILKLLYRKSMSVEEIADKLALQPITIRHHMQSLVESGFVDTVEERGRSVGRPKIYYKMLKEPPLVSYPKRQYLELTSFIINTLRTTTGEAQAKKLLRRAGFEMGVDTVKKLVSEHGINEWDSKAYEQYFIGGYLEKIGAEPEILEVSTRRISYCLHNCLFSEVSIKMPEIMCDTLHEGFHEGLIKTMGKDVRLERKTCMSKGDAFCEYSFEWRD